MTWLNYHHLYYFWTIAKDGSIAKAAERLRLGQPTLSTQLKQLEQALGCDLFERRNRRMILTDSGKIAFDYANEIFRIGGELVEVLKDRLPQARQHIQIGALDSVPKQIIMKLVESAMQTNDCSVSILEGRSEELLRELSGHRLDLLLANFPPAVTEDTKFFARSIGKLPVIVCGAKKFSKLKKNFPQSLAAEPMILPTLHSKLRHDLDHFFRVQQINVNIVSECQDTSLQLQMGASGLGLVALAAPAAADFIKRGELVSLGTLPQVTEELWLVSAKRKIENAVAARLMKKFQLD